MELIFFFLDMFNIICWVRELYIEWFSDDAVSGEVRCPASWSVLELLSLLEGVVYLSTRKVGLVSLIPIFLRSRSLACLVV